MNIILRWIITALAVAAAVWLVPGIDILATTETWAGVACMALVLALLDISLKPVLQVLSMPITCLTLGIFYLVVNTAMLYAASWLANNLFHIGFIIQSFGSAFVAAIVISIVSALLNGITGANEQ